MLWDLIRDFFVQHVFGGADSLGDLYDTKIGDGITFLEGELDEGFQTASNIYYKVGDVNGQTFYLPLNDWLSTTATAISITIIVVLCCLFVYKIIKLIGGLIR